MNITHELSFAKELSLNEIVALVKANPNDKILGRIIRKVITDYDKNKR